MALIAVLFTICWGIYMVLELNILSKTLKKVASESEIYWSSVYNLVLLALQYIKGLKFYTILFVIGIFMILLIINNGRGK